ncbi:glycosyltransferase family 8 protein [Trametes elegans]|nr:glycosyltransferase family 8 protein [Trametes elegans]
MLSTLPRRFAYAALLSTMDYFPGLLVMHKSLMDTGTRYPLVVLTTPNLPPDVRDVLRRRGMDVRVVEPLQPHPDNAYDLPLHDIRFAETWTKIRMFQLVEYERLVVLDADILIRRNMDELMEFHLPSDHIAAVHVCVCNPTRLSHYPKDWIPANCAHAVVSGPNGLPPVPKETSPRPYRLLNGGVVVQQPSLRMFEDLHRFLMESPLVREFSFADQDLFAEFFKGRWKPLSWRFNGLKTLRVAHPAMWDDEVVCCVHYILNDKPWKYRPGAGSPADAVLNQWWWDGYEELRAQMAMADPRGWKLVEARVAPALPYSRP